MTTRDGFEYVPGSGKRKNLSSKAVVEPDESQVSENEIYDVVVIGAGYAGLTAARDLSKSGMPYFPVMIYEAH